MRTTHFPNVQPSPSSHRDASAPAATNGHVVLTGKEQHEISLADAARLTRNFREHADRGAAKGGLIERGIIEKILAQEACVGIRLYHGLNAKYQRMMVLVGVTAQGSNQLDGALGGVHAYRAPYGSAQNILNVPTADVDVAALEFEPVLDLRQNPSVTLAEAADLTRRYRDESDTATVKAFYYSQGIFSKILAQKDCIGIRYYYGCQDNLEPCLVLVGVTRGGDDLIPGILGEIGVPCPPICGALDVLNS